MDPYHIAITSGSTDESMELLRRKMAIHEEQYASSCMKVNPCRNCLVNSAEKGFLWSITKHRINHFLN